jgi:hypothetical protein
MSHKEKIASAGNVLVPAFLSLKEMGYLVERVKSDSPDGKDFWRAENEQLELIAEDPVTLLALATIYATRGKNWKASDSEIDDFIEKYEKL